VRATARLVHVAKDTVARLLRRAGRHAERFHDQRVHDVTPRALEFDEQWSFVKKSRSTARRMSVRRPVTCGITRRLLPIASWWSLWSLANAPTSRRNSWSTTPSAGCVPGICQRFSPMRIAAMSQPCWRRLAIVTRNRAVAHEAVARVLWCVGPKAWRMGKYTKSTKVVGSCGSTCRPSGEKHASTMCCTCSGITIWVWLFYDDVHLMISKCGARLRCCMRSN
jgi:hypothetical protein